MKNLTPRAVTLLLAFFLVPAWATTVLELNWDDLKPVIEFDDPFEVLSKEQLGKLSLVARIHTEMAAGTVIGEETQKEVSVLEQELTRDGIDIDGLLARREEIRRLREKRDTSVVNELDGAFIRMPGFVLPLEFFGTKVTEFLLVPWIGACIHTPPPPPNQIVHVLLDEKNAFESKGRFEPVWVAGRMNNKAASVNLFLNDGAGDIDIAYQLHANLVEPYKK